MFEGILEARQWFSFFLKLGVFRLQSGGFGFGCKKKNEPTQRLVFNDKTWCPDKVDLQYGILWMGAVPASCSS